MSDNVRRMKIASLKDELKCLQSDDAEFPEELRKLNHLIFDILVMTPLNNDVSELLQKYSVQYRHVLNVNDVFSNHIKEMDKLLQSLLEIEEE